MNLMGAWVLTDPVFSTRVGPGRSPLVLGPKRYLRPALEPREIPAPDVILLSHAHFDHLDLSSLRRFRRDTPVVTARNTSDLLHRCGFKRVHELGWSETLTLKLRDGTMEVTALEVQHWGARMRHDVYRGYNGYLLERDGALVCFAGDTADTRAFSRLRHRRRPVDLMIMPIGAYDPWIRSHCSPEQAVTMSLEAGARSLLPVHHSTFRLSDEPMGEPAERVQTAMANAGGHLAALHIGETFRLAAGN